MKSRSILLRDFLDAVSDAYGLENLWSIGRDERASEDQAPRIAREVLFELADSGYVQFLIERRAGDWHELSAEEANLIRSDMPAWGIESDKQTTLQVTSTPSGDEALRNRVFR